MAFASGRNGGFMLADGSTTKRNISSYLNSVDFSRAADTAEVTTFNTTQNAKVYLPGNKDASISFEGKFDPTVDGYLAGALNKVKAFTYYTNSTAPAVTTFVRYSGSCILTKYDIGTPNDDAVSFSCDAQVTGAITRSTASS